LVRAGACLPQALIWVDDMSEDEAGEFLTKRQLLLCTKEDGAPDVGKPDEVSRARVFASIGTRPAVLEKLGKSTPEAVEGTQRLEAEKLVTRFLKPTLDPGSFTERVSLVEAMLAGKGAFRVGRRRSLAAHRMAGGA
jgi:hypothetical protein